MAHPLAVRGKLSFHIGSAGRVLPAGLAGLDFPVAACRIRLPAVLDSAARGLLTWQSDWFAPDSISDRDAVGQWTCSGIAQASCIS